MRNDSSTAFLSHSWTCQVPASFSATRNPPESSRPSTDSTAARTSPEAFCGVMSARDSKAPSMVACNSLYGTSVQRPHQRIPQARARLLLQEAALGVGDVKNVLGALAHRHDLRAVDGDPFRSEVHADFREQSRDS